MDLSGWVGVGFGGNCDAGVVSYMRLSWGGEGVAGLMIG